MAPIKFLGVLVGIPSSAIGWPTLRLSNIYPQEIVHPHPLFSTWPRVPHYQVGLCLMGGSSYGTLFRTLPKNIDDFWNISDCGQDLLLLRASVTATPVTVTISYSDSFSAQNGPSYTENHCTQVC